MMATPGNPANASSSKPQRVLACVLCQQRKVKCERKFPCSNCLRAGTQCVPATLNPRRRRRKNPEKEILDRLQRYEDLLREHNIDFEHLKTESTRYGDQNETREGHHSDDESRDVGNTSYPSPSTTVKSEDTYEAKNFWRAMNRGYRDPSYDSDSSEEEIIRKTTVEKLLHDPFQHTDHLLFGSNKAAFDIAILHPDSIQIFRLWQLYVDNVHPLLKVTHVPTLQADIIEAASDVQNIDGPLQSLMFAIYTMAVLSIDTSSCLTIFGTSRQELLTKYQYACNQALQNCGLLQSDDRIILTAFYLYLVSFAWTVHPRSLSSMLGVAMRIAQRMGLNNESDNAKHSPFEAEMRRRLWWSLTMFDVRASEIANFKHSLTPTWDARPPLNVNDSDLRVDMKESTLSQVMPSDAIFAVVRSEMGDYIRSTLLHLDFTTPALKPLAKYARPGSMPAGGELLELEQKIENKYLVLCDPENPVHFMTIWAARAYLAKSRLLEHYSRCSGATTAKQSMQAQQDASISTAIRMLECDSTLLNSSLTKGFCWYIQPYFPLPAYVHLIQYLKKKPAGEKAWEAWEAMDENIRARTKPAVSAPVAFSDLMASLVLQAWTARKAASIESGFPWPTPGIVTFFGDRAAATEQSTAPTSTGLPSASSDEYTQQIDSLMSAEGLFNLNDTSDLDFDPFAMPMSMAPFQFDFSQQLYGTEPGASSNTMPFAPSDQTINQLDWATLGLNLDQRS